MIERVTTHRYDVRGSEITRVGRHFLRTKFIPFGNFGGGPGIKHLALATCAHLLGAGVAWMLIFFEPRLRRAAAVVIRVAGRRRIA